MNIFKKIFRTGRRRELLDALERSCLEASELTAAVHALIEQTALQNEYLTKATGDTLKNIAEVTGAMARYFDTQVKYFLRMEKKEAEAENIKPTAHDFLF